MDLTEAMTRYPGGVSFTFGDGPELNAEILALVREGRKTVTCDAWDAFAMRGEPLPEPGRIDIATDWSRRPAFALRTLSVERVRFDEMTEAQVKPQGEFRDLAEWRKGYEAYLRRAGMFRPDVEMLMETFEVVEDFG